MSPLVRAFYRLLLDLDFPIIINHILRHRVEMRGQEAQRFNQLINTPRERKLARASLNSVLSEPV
jgi:hypothetical protein